MEQNRHYSLVVKSKIIFKRREAPGALGKVPPRHLEGSENSDLGERGILPDAFLPRPTEGRCAALWPRPLSLIFP